MSISAKAEYEFLYDKPYDDNKKVRVAGPFTVESLSPHLVLGVDEDDELWAMTGRTVYFLQATLVSAFSASHFRGKRWA